MKYKKITSFLIICIVFVMTFGSISVSAETMTNILAGKSIEFFIGEDINVFDALMAADNRLSHLKNGSCFTGMTLNYIDNSSQYYTINGEMVKGKKEGTTSIAITGSAQCGAQSISEQVNGSFAIIVKKRLGVAVTGITGLPDSIPSGIDFPLTVSILPENASNQDIVWSVKSAGTTGASINNGTLKTTAGGTLVLTAAITDGIAEGQSYTKDFTLNVLQSFVEVAELKLNLQGVVTEGKEINLSVTVQPSSASNKAIIWRIKDAGTTGAVINGSKFKALNSGKAIIIATIEGGLDNGDDYVQEFTITVKASSPDSGDNTSIWFLWIFTISSLSLIILIYMKKIRTKS